MGKDVVQLAASHDELHKVIVFEIDLEGQESDQLRDVVLDVITDHCTLDWIQSFVLQAL